MNGSEIWKRRAELDRQRRDYMRTVMREFDKEQARRLEELRTTCAELTGHAWAFIGHGPVGHVWNHCRYCRTSKVDDPG